LSGTNRCPLLRPARPSLILEANWARSIQSQPQVKVRVGKAEFNAFARDAK
jgi:hypothetical protein